MPREPAWLDRAGESGAILVRRAARSHECAIDQLDKDAAVLHRLDCVGDLHQLAGGDVGIGEGARLDELESGPKLRGTVLAATD
jgi:hypothetical protein